MDLKVLIFLCLFANVCAFKILSGQKLKDYIKNLGHKLWKGRSLTQDEMNYYKHRLGGPSTLHTEFEPQLRLSFANNTQNRALTLPDAFDARYDKWPECRSVISEIQDQSRCGSCWAVATTSMLSDRICIATHGEKKPQLSAINLAQCCVDCHGNGNKENGCGGGDPLMALKHFAKEGIVTGGKYGSNVGCRPYPFSPTEQAKMLTSGACQETCDNQSYEYSKHKYHGKTTNIGYLPGIDNIKTAIYYYGPVVASMDVYEELFTYNVDPNRKDDKGIYYIMNSSTERYRHSVRVLGWGYEVDKGTRIDYWRVANSWGPKWGDGGTVKIVMDTNEGGIETNMITADYDVNSNCR